MGKLGSITKTRKRATSSAESSQVKKASPKSTSKSSKVVKKTSSSARIESASSKRSGTSMSAKKVETSKTNLKKVDSNSSAGVSTPETRGLSLGAKLSITISLVSAILTLAVGFTIALQTKSFISEEIIKSGVNGVKFLSSQAKVLVNNYYDGNEENVIKFKEKIEGVLKGSSLTHLLKDSEGTDTTILDGYITMSEVNGGTSGLIFSLNGNEKSPEVDYLKGRIFPEDPTKKSDLIIRKAILTKNNIKYPVYVFEMDLRIEVSSLFKGSNFRPEKGKAWLFLSISKVAESESAVFKMTAIILAIAVLVSILIAYFLSKSITSPILQLVNDMTIVQRGNLEHTTQAHSADEIGYLSQTFNQVTKSLKTAHAAEIVKEKLEHDMSVGKEIQQTLLPKNIDQVQGYDCDAFYLSAKEVGGDYYDLLKFSKSKSKLGVVVADVSGKGIQGAMIMTIMRTIMNIAAMSSKSSTDCLSKTNKFLTPKIKRGMFVTAFYVVLDYANNHLKFCSAGHNPMIIYRAKTKTIEMFNPTGIALGFDKGPLFDKVLKEGETTLEKGDRFVLYTDGVVESMNEAREEYSDPRFNEFVLKHARLDSKTFVQKLVADLKKHQGKAEQHDDITIVTFRKIV